MRAFSRAVLWLIFNRAVLLRSACLKSKPGTAHVRAVPHALPRRARAVRTRAVPVPCLVPSGPLATFMYLFMGPRCIFFIPIWSSLMRLKLLKLGIGAIIDKLLGPNAYSCSIINTHSQLHLLLFLCLCIYNAKARRCCDWKWKCKLLFYFIFILFFSKLYTRRHSFKFLKRNTNMRIF